MDFIPFVPVNHFSRVALMVVQNGGTFNMKEPLPEACQSLAKNFLKFILWIDAKDLFIGKRLKIVSLERTGFRA